MGEVFQKREIVILDVHNRFEKKNVDDFLQGKGYHICQSKIDKRLNVEFVNATVAREVRDFFENKQLIYNDKQFKFSLKGNRFLIENLVGSFQEIKNFFQNYGEVNNVYYTKKYFATLSSIKQAIQLVEREKSICIDGTQMQVRFAFDRNIGNLNNPNKNFQIRSKEANASNAGPSGIYSSKSNISKSSVPVKAKQNIASKMVLISTESKETNRSKKATGVKQNQKSAGELVKTFSQATSAKQTAVSSNVKQSGQSTNGKQQTKLPSAVKQNGNSVTAKQASQPTIVKQTNDSKDLKSIEPTAAKQNGNSTTDKQASQPATVKQTDELDCGFKEWIEYIQSNNEIEHVAKKDDKLEVPKQAKKRTRRKRNKSSSAGSDTVNESDNSSTSQIKSTTRKEDNALSLNGLLFNLPKTVNSPNQSAKEATKSTKSKSKITDSSSNKSNGTSGTNGTTKLNASLYSKGPNSAEPFKNAKKSVIGSLQNTLDSLNHKSDNFKSIDYLEDKDSDVAPGIVRTYFKSNHDSSVRPPPFAKQFEIKLPTTEEEVSPLDMSNASMVTAAAASFQDTAPTPIKDVSMVFDKSTLKTPKQSPSHQTKSSRAFSSNKKSDNCIIS